MAKRTVHIPDALDDRVVEHGNTDDSYSGIVTEALRFYLDHEEQIAEAPAEN